MKSTNYNPTKQQLLTQCQELVNKIDTGEARIKYLKLGKLYNRKGDLYQLKTELEYLIELGFVTTLDRDFLEELGIKCWMDNEQHIKMGEVEIYQEIKKIIDNQSVSVQDRLLTIQNKIRKQWKLMDEYKEELKKFRR